MRAPWHIFSALTLAPLLLLGMAPYAMAGQFSVVDEKADSEISENARIYLDGRLVATFRLDDTNRSKVIKVTTPVGRIDHSYTLCGEITIRTPEGRVETHEVSSDGLLHNPDGHRLYAMGADGFTDFFLTDPDSPTTAEHTPGHSDVCAAPIS